MRIDSPIRLWLILWPLFACLLTVACETQTTHPPSSVQNKASLHAPIAGSTDQLVCKLLWPQADFRVQALDFTKFRYLRLWVRGENIADRMWNNGGYVSIQGNGSTLAVSTVPKGRNRVVTVQAYDENHVPIPGALLKGYYSSLASSDQVVVHLEWRYWPVSNILEQLWLKNSPVLYQLNTGGLQGLLDAHIFGTNPVTSKNYQTHPVQFNIATMVNLLEQGGVAALQAAPKTILAPSNFAQVVVRTSQNTPFNSDIVLQLNDPPSTRVVIPAGSDTAQLPEILPGTWTVNVALAGLGGGTQATTTLTVQEDRTVTMAAGTLASPIQLAPVLKTLSPAQPVPNPAGLNSWWRGEDNANDSGGSNHGTAQNGLGYSTGFQGRAFQFDGINDKMDVPHHASLNPGSGDMTFVAWVNPNSSNQFQTGIFRKLHPGPGDYYIFQLTGLSPLYELRDNPSGLGNNFGGASPGQIIPRMWNMMTWRLDRTAGTMRTYINGQPDFTFNLPTLDESIDPGSGVEFGTHVWPFAGMLDEMQWYNRALSDGEIQALYSFRTITISGDGFSPIPANNTVKFGTTPGVVSAATTTSLTVNVPTGIYGVSGITVTVNGQTSAVGSINTRPVIYALNKPAGKVGEVITITGDGFDPNPAGNTVTFNGTPAIVNTAAVNSLNVTIPVGATTGNLTVTTTGGATPVGFYTVEEPYIKTYYPSSGIPNTKIQILGHNLTGTTSVKFNGLEAAAIFFKTDSEIWATVPVGATSGPITVTTPQGTVAGVNTFTTPISNLVHHWPADGNGTDIVGGNTANLMNGATYAAGMMGQAFGFDGVNDFVRFTSNLPDMASFSVSLWTNFTGAGTGALLVDADGAGGNDTAFEMNPTSLGVRADKNGLSLLKMICCGGPIATGLTLNNGWHYLVWTVDPAQTAVYVDGQIKEILAIPGSNVGNHLTNSLGVWWDGVTIYGNYYTGQMDDVRIYNKMLSGIEITGLYNARPFVP